MTYHPVWLTDAQIAAGHNNAGGLAALEGTIPTNGTAFLPMTMYPNYNPGQFQIRGNGIFTLGGFATVAWQLGYVTWIQERYLRATYCSAGYSGLVTVRTVTETDGTYANYNATMILAKRVDGQQLGDVLTDYEIRFTRMVAI